MKQKSRVCVVISIFNPEIKWLNLLLNSIQEQKEVDVNLAIRFDQIEMNLDSLDLPEASKMTITSGENLGSNRSFLTLVRENKADFFAFADQDDLWVPEKLISSVNKMSDDKTAQLTYCSYKLIDSESKKIRSTTRNVPKRINRFTFLFSNGVPGCCTTINGNTRSLLIDSSNYIPKEIELDWWINCLVSIFGTVKWTGNVGIEYRIHKKNQIGMQISLIARINYLIKTLEIRRNKSKMLLSSLSEYIRFAQIDTPATQFVLELSAGLNRNRLYRLLLVLKHGVLISSIRDIGLTMIFYVLA